MKRWLSVSEAYSKWRSINLIIIIINTLLLLQLTSETILVPNKVTNQRRSQHFAEKTHEQMNDVKWSKITALVVELNDTSFSPSKTYHSTI